MELEVQHDRARFEEQAGLAARARFSQWRELELKQRPARILRFSAAIAVAIAVVLLISFRLFTGQPAAPDDVHRRADDSRLYGKDSGNCFGIKPGETRNHT
jgi:hypothetical protein